MRCTLGTLDCIAPSDVMVLKRARMEQRVVVTADLDYTRLLALSQTDGPGLILFRAGNYSEHETVERLKRGRLKNCSLQSSSSRSAGFVVGVFPSKRACEGARFWA